jgi:D-alanyl-D-alanine carboxypeptidase/D-alanyl-D-alanine-endopeptidase (penicillin-binding protein 4)
MNDELKTRTIINSLVKFIILNPIAIGSSFIIFLSSCSIQKQITKTANKDVLDAAPLQTAHIGISIYEPATNKYWYDYQGDKYFVPASNIKIPTCYAAMKYLGDSLEGLRYGYPEEKIPLIAIQPTADPTFLHKDFKNQHVFHFLSDELLTKKKNVGFMDTVWKDERWGNGWSWDDYTEPYMAERNSFPIFGNVIDISQDTEKKYFRTTPSFFDSIINQYWEGQYFSEQKFNITRDISANIFDFIVASEPFINQVVPFVTINNKKAFDILNDTLNSKCFDYVNLWPDEEKNSYLYTCSGCDVASLHINKWAVIHSQPTDSVLKPMMHRSDNFFAEQLLLMVSNERLGTMNDEKIIDTLLKTDFKDLPQKPGWVDGSGLSRYNLFSPKDFVFILNKMKNEFGMERAKIIFPTGGQGTLADYYTADSNYIYAKTGTLSGVIAISGYLYTKKGKELIFSVLVNNHKASGTEVRRSVEKFLKGVRNKY